MAEISSSRPLISRPTEAARLTYYSGITPQIPHPLIVRPAEAARLTGIPRSSLYWRINQGTFPPVVKLGPRSSGFLLAEVQAVLEAHIAGWPLDRIQALVRELVSRRPSLAA